MYGNKKNKDVKRTLLVKEVARKNGISKRTVERCIEGTRNNDEVVADYDDLNRAIENTIEAYQNNRLMAAVKQLVPFN